MDDGQNQIILVNVVFRRDRQHFIFLSRVFDQAAALDDSDVVVGCEYLDERRWEQV